MPAATPSRFRTIAYWMTTLLVALEMALGGVWDAIRIAVARHIAALPFVMVMKDESDFRS